jgi:hypothetical protein
MGGTYDPETGRLVWTFRIPFDEQRRHYAATPPGSLAPLSCTPVDLADFPFDGHGEPVNVCFQVGCPCGSDLFSVTAFLREGEVTPPITLVCARCATEQTVFDDSKHGWDGALGTFAPVEEPDPGCPAALGAAQQQVIVRFEFASDVLGNDQWQGREHDLFTWITLVGKDPRHGWLTTLFDYECA